jgi:hypothetical protein
MSIQPQQRTEAQPAYTNANRYIMNNANKYLVSPYSPNQVVQNTNTQSVIRADVILPYTAGGTIQIESPINVQELTIQGTVGGDSTSVANSSTSLTCTTDSIVGTVAGATEVIITTTSATFGSASTGNYVIGINGQFGLNTSNDPSPGYGITGFTPIAVNSVQYYLPLYGLSGPFIQPLPPPTDAPGGTTVVDPTTATSYIGGTSHTLASSTTTGQMKTLISTAGGVTVTGTFYKDGIQYGTLTFSQAGQSAVLSAYSTGWIIVNLAGVTVS